MQKVPYILVVGDKEKASGAVAVRARGNLDLGVMPLDEFSQKIAERHRQQGLSLAGALVLVVRAVACLTGHVEGI